MSRIEKLLARFRQNPKNVRYEELETVLLYYGFERLDSRGSHMKFVLGMHILVIPYRKPFLKPIYIKLALALLEEIVEDLDG